VLTEGILTVACGMISQYNLPNNEHYGVKNLFYIVSKRIKMQGFIVRDKDFGPKYFNERNERISAVRTAIHLSVAEKGD
jgi:hypothetical protein